MDDSLFVEIWDTFKEYIPEKSKDMAAMHYVDFLLDILEVKDLEEFIGYDPHLDHAINEIIGDAAEFEDTEEPIDENEDEDY